MSTSIGCTTAFSSNAVCGNGVKEGAEMCDTDDFGGKTCADFTEFKHGELLCTAQCKLDISRCHTCGNGTIEGSEVCDGDNLGNASCMDYGFYRGKLECLADCSGVDTSGCEGYCGDGIVDGDYGEECDHEGETVYGCSADCTIEEGWECTGQPSVCTPICGDGVITGDQECDDGNTAPGDGCSTDCRREFGWECSGEPSICHTIPVLYKLSTNDQEWSVTEITAANNPHAPIDTIIGAASVEKRKEAYVFTAATFHLLDVDSGEWLEHGTVESRFPDLPSSGYAAAYGLELPERPEESLIYFLVPDLEGAGANVELVIYIVDDFTGEVEHGDTKPEDLSNLGPDHPAPQEIKALYVDMLNTNGWVSGSPKDDCAGCATTAEEVDWHGVWLTESNNFHITTSYCDWYFCWVMPFEELPPFQLEGAPPVEEILEFFYLEPALYVFAQKQP